MKDIVLTTYIIGNKKIDLGKIPSNIEILKYTENEMIENAKGKYITFIDSDDTISPNYFTTILKEIKKNEFELCYINYEINYNYKRKPKIRHTKEALNNIIPVYNPYIWNYIYKKEILLKIKDITITRDDLKNTSYISKPIYFHNHNRLSTKILNMCTRRRTIHYKNIIYIENYCNGTFNGYVTWLLEIGKAFPELEITIIYTEINSQTKNRLSKYFECIQFNPSINYTCDRFITTYSTYFYPNNIFSLEESSIFIHGNMSDYKNTRKYTDDIYDRYIAVSQVSQKKAKGYFPTKNIEFIYNPYTFDKSTIKPHLKLISAIRNSPEKGIDRIKQVASILDEENIPYTWQVFTDVLEKNQGGLIFRNAIPNVIDYVSDSDYLVQLSSSESLSYSITEALCCNIKIITTDIPAIHELNIIDGVNGIVIPFKYFTEKNKHLLKEKILEAYNKKDLEFNYTYPKSRFNDYQNVFKN